MSYTVNVSGYTEIYDSTARQLIAHAWPDGIISAYKKSGSNYTAWQADGEFAFKMVKLVGPIGDPGAAHSVIDLGSPPSFASYATGGVTLSLDGGDTNLVQVTHLERWPLGSASHFYASLGLARTADGGVTFNCLNGDIITFSKVYNPSETVYGFDIGGGPIVPVDGGWYYAYFTEYLEDITSYISVARCSIATFNSYVLADTIPPFDKLQGDGTWGGSNTGAPLAGLPAGYWMDVMYDSQINRYLMLLPYNITLPNAIAKLYSSANGRVWTYECDITDENAGSGEGVVYVGLVPNTFTGVRTGQGPWTAFYSYGQRFDFNVLRSRTFSFDITADPPLPGIPRSSSVFAQMKG